MSCQRQITYTYDALDRLVAAQHSNGTQVRYTYDPAGNRTSAVVAPDVQPLAPTPQQGLVPGSSTLTVLSGPLANRQVRVGEQLRLGRESDNDLTLPDPGASRYHAIIQREGEGFQISDLGSAHGTRVNGERIMGPERLKDGDSILVGETRLTFSE
jgi:YD repeat-containing protein